MVNYGGVLIWFTDWLLHSKTTTWKQARLMSGEAMFRLKLEYSFFQLPQYVLIWKLISEWMNSLTLLSLFLPTIPLPQTSFICPSFRVSCLCKPSLFPCHTLFLSSVFPLQQADWLEARQTVQLGNAVPSCPPLSESNKSNTDSYTFLYAHTITGELKFLCL